jgi:hypothetical protein
MDPRSGQLDRGRQRIHFQGGGLLRIKLKLCLVQEFVIGGYTDPEGSRKHFGALLVGCRFQLIRDRKEAGGHAATASTCDDSEGDIGCICQVLR